MSPTSSQVAGHYALMQAQTASHAKRICMIHERCLELAIMAGEESSVARKRLCQKKAQSGLLLLQESLQEKDPVSLGLYHLYGYCYALLGRGDQADLSNAVEILTILKTTFNEILRS